MKNNLKTNITNPVYQSTFLPILSKAETKIKDLIVSYANLLKPKSLLRVKIREIINDVNRELPIDIIDRQTYIVGLLNSSERLIKEYYDKSVAWWLFLTAIMLRYHFIKKVPKTLVELAKTINKMKDFEIKALNYHQRQEKKHLYDLEFIVENKDKYHIDLTSEAKGFPNVENYIDELKKRLQGVSRTEFAPSEEGKKKITMWQKAELDLRHENQMKMVDDLKAKGVQYAWTSSHPDCSKRCQKWQGKLFDLVNLPNAGKFKMKDKLDGNTVYSFRAVAEQVDKYGYTNNIIVGFNCRHKLIEWEKGSVAPTEYNEEEIRKQREINAKLREYERRIREAKRNYKLYLITDKNSAKMYLELANRLTKEYTMFAKKHGYAVLKYRLEV